MQELRAAAALNLDLDRLAELHRCGPVGRGGHTLEGVVDRLVHAWQVVAAVARIDVAAGGNQRQSATLRSAGASRRPDHSRYSAASR